MKSPLIKFAQEHRRKNTRYNENTSVNEKLADLAEAIHDENLMIEKRIMKNIKKMEVKNEK